MSGKNKPPIDKVPLQPCFPPRETLFAAAALCGAGLLAYSNSFTGQFILDDGGFVDNLRTRPLWECLLAPNSLPRPVVGLTWAFNYALGGLAVGGYHAFNLAVHLLAALTLFGIVRRTLRLDGLRERFDAVAGWLALAGALLWLAHPLQTESVTYISQRAESLAGLFYLLTLYCVIRGAEVQPLEKRPVSASHRAAAWRWFALALLACALGMACKPILATAPLVVFAFDRIFLAKDAATALHRRWGLYTGLAATWLILAALIFISPADANAGFGMTALTPAAYAQTQFGIILHYLRLSFWPTALCLDYLWPVAHRLDEILPGALVVGTLAGATLWAWVRHPVWSFLGVWFFIILAPTSSFMPLADPAVEHRLYLPLAALVMLAVVSAYLLGVIFLRRLSVPEARRQALGRLAATVSIATATALLGYLTYQRNMDYHDPLAMWYDVLEKRPENWRAYGNRGILRRKMGDYDGAVTDQTKALELNPRSENAYGNRGSARLDKGDYDGAIADYTTALELNPCCAQTYDNRGTARYRKGDYDGALADFTKVVDLERSNWQALIRIGLILVKTGREAEAQACFEEGLKINPGFRSSLAGKIAQARAERQVLLGKTQAGK